MGQRWPPPSHASHADWFSKEDRVCEWSQLVACCLQMDAAGSRGQPGPLVNGASPVGGEQARGDSPSLPLSLLRLGVRRGEKEVPQTLLSADRFTFHGSSSVLASPVSVRIKSSGIHTQKVKTRWKFTFLSCKEVQR